MSVPHQYHQPNAPDPVEDDGDSDLDLELRELIAPSRNERLSTPHSPRSSRDQSIRDFATRIPLRNLRAGRRHIRTESEDELLRDDMDEEEDGEPLLPSYDRRPHVRSESTLSRLSSTLRLPTFASGSLRPSLPLQTSVEEEPEEEHDPSSTRTVLVGQRQFTRFPPNVVSNAKYTFWSFLPRTLYNEFKFFLNMYFLLVALSQI